MPNFYIRAGGSWVQIEDEGAGGLDGPAGDGPPQTLRLRVDYGKAYPGSGAGSRWLKQSYFGNNILVRENGGFWQGSFGDTPFILDPAIFVCHPAIANNPSSCVTGSGYYWRSAGGGAGSYLVSPSRRYDHLEDYDSARDQFHPSDGPTVGPDPGGFLKSVWVFDISLLRQTPEFLALGPDPIPLQASISYSLERAEASLEMIAVDGTGAFIPLPDYEPYLEELASSTHQLHLMSDLQVGISIEPAESCFGVGFPEGEDLIFPTDGDFGSGEIIGEFPMEVTEFDPLSGGAASYAGAMPSPFTVELDPLLVTGDVLILGMRSSFNIGSSRIPQPSAPIGAYAWSIIGSVSAEIERLSLCIRYLPAA